MIRKTALLALLLALSFPAIALAQDDKDSDKQGGAATPSTNVDQMDDSDIVDVTPPSDDDQDATPPSDDDQDATPSSDDDQDAAPPDEDDQDAAPPEEDQTLSAEEINDILDEADAYRDGSGGKKQDYKKAMSLYMEAADAGDYYAMNAVGLLYDNGQGVKEDDTKAFDWYQKAANAGNYVAMSNVGNMFEYGDGVEQSYAEAMKWYRKAVDEGDFGLAMYYIGGLYRDAKGVDEDYEEAASWYQKAVDVGQKDAHWSLALLYLYGSGVSKDTQKAADLAYYALTHGVQATIDNFKDIKSKDTSANFRKALQQLLKEGGFYSGTIDGSFGPATQKAIAAAFNTES